ncbi:MAG: alkaline phosphatase family protein [Microbacteriaceae bacterium]|nr:alkaline phosphatase family protein [Microbacteriaceae bacterium]
MLPAPKTHRLSLADVMPSCLNSLLGQKSSLGLTSVDKAVVLLVDGLGTEALAARAGHARTLASLLNRGSTIGAGFPSTTAAALATLTTGTRPGQHGLVGYSVLDAANDRVVNQLKGWDDRLDPATWQRQRTVFEQATDVDIPSFVVAAEKYRHSGFTHAVLRGADFRGAASITDRFRVVREILDTTARALVYMYVPELDMAAHSEGWESPLWTRQLETVDTAVREFSASLRRREGLLLTADHGIIDVPHRSHILFGEAGGLVDGIRFVAGEPRCLQLHFEPDASVAVRQAVLEAWQAAESERSWILARSEAIAAGWFGATVDSEVVPRIGDVLVAARKNIAYYDERVTGSGGRNMIGQHGSLTDAETKIPLLRFGAFVA